MTEKEKFGKRGNPIMGAIRLIAVLGAFIGVVLLVFNFTIVPKDPVTSDKMWEVLESQGYQPIDITEKYYAKDSGAKQTLIKCIAFEKDDIHFEFYEFNNKNSAIDVYGQAYRSIILDKNKFSKVEHSTQKANYTIYTLKVSGTYNVAIYVGNTAIYAYCNEENSNEIGDILKEIGYFN